MLQISVIDIIMSIIINMSISNAKGLKKTEGVNSESLTFLRRPVFIFLNIMMRRWTLDWTRQLKQKVISQYT